MNVEDGQQPRPRSRRGGAARRWMLTLALATLAVAAAIPTQAVVSEMREEMTEPVDPDCLPPAEAEKSPEERDGVCPTDPSPAPKGPADPDPPSEPKNPSPSDPPASKPDSAPTTTAKAPAAGAQAPARGPSERRRAARETSGADRGGDRRARRPRTRSDRRRRAVRHEGRRGHARRRGQRKQAQRGRRRDRRDGLHSGGITGGPALGPMPGWARRLLTQPLPDPLPAGKRLDPGFARSLARIAAEHDVSWPLVLAVLRARGNEGAVPADHANVRALARRLAQVGASRNPRHAIEALSGTRDSVDPAPAIGRRVTFADRVLSLAGYHRAVGLSGLVRGLDAVKPALIERVLESDELDIYPGGRADVEAGRIDERVLVLMLYLVHRHRSVTVSSLQSGHSVFTKSGNISNHSFGQAVDISALGDVPIMGHQEPGGVTERALQNILLLPKELWPSELISLFDMGGPSFAMGDHADHIHAGF